MEGNNHKKLPLGLKIAAGYLVLSGFMGIIWPLLGSGPNYSEFEVKSLAYKAGAYSRDYLLNIIFIVSGIALFFRKLWARKIAMIALVIGIIYTSNEFAWGFAGGTPSTNIRVFSLCIVGLWNGIWFYLIYRKSTVEVLN